MKKFPAALAALAATTLCLAACGSDPEAVGPVEDDQSPAVVPADDEHDEQSANSEEDPPEGGETGEVLGVVRINDFTTYAITELRNCDPLNDGTIERELELQGFGEHEGTPIQIDVYKQFVGGVGANEVSWSGPEGVFGSAQSAQITWGPDSTNVLGSATLVDAMTQTERIMIGFDLQVPAETVACR